MLKYRSNSLRAWKLAAALISLLALVFVLPLPLRADKKKADAPPPVKPGDQRVKAFVDITKIVWPNPPGLRG